MTGNPPCYDVLDHKFVDKCNIKQMFQPITSVKTNQMKIIRIAISFSLCVISIIVLTIPQIGVKGISTTPECGGQSHGVCLSVGCYGFGNRCATFQCAKCDLPIWLPFSYCFPTHHICTTHGEGGGGGDDDRRVE